MLIKIMILASIFFNGCGANNSAPDKPTHKSPAASEQKVKEKDEPKKQGEDANKIEQQPQSEKKPDNHAKLTNDCVKCHEKDRPNMVSNKKHGGGLSCEECHQTGENPLWVKTKDYSHLPEPKVCEDCHDRPKETSEMAYPLVGTPAGFKSDDPKALGSGHFVGKDCLACHKSLGQGVNSFSWDHSGKNPSVCLPCHFKEGKDKHGSIPIGIELNGFGNCINCHKNFDKNKGRNFKATILPGL